jgi:hypothetical protein
MSLMRFQADHDIQPADGNPTQATLDALGIPDLFTPAPAPKPVNPLNQIFITWLALIRPQRSERHCNPMTFRSDWRRCPRSSSRSLLIAIGCHAKGSVDSFYGLPLDPSLAFPHDRHRLITGRRSVFTNQGLRNQSASRISGLALERAVVLHADRIRDT